MRLSNIQGLSLFVCFHFVYFAVKGSRLEIEKPWETFLLFNQNNIFFS